MFVLAVVLVAEALCVRWLVGKGEGEAVLDRVDEMEGGVGRLKYFLKSLTTLHSIDCVLRST